MRINIAGGTGPMGKVHKPLFEKFGHEVIISGRSTTPTLEEAAQNSDLTIVCVPIPATEEIIKRIAPHCNALMDFTGLKEFPINAMKKYAREDIEIGGLHPLYGEVQNLTGKTVIYCPTNRSGKKCNNIVSTFEKSGLLVKTMSAQEHDVLITGIAQNARTMILESFGLLLEKYGISAREMYELSPPPTKVLLDLLARQVNPENDSLYQDMREYNNCTPKIKALLIKTIEEDNTNLGARIRKIYGADFLKEAQDRAKLLI